MVDVALLELEGVVFDTRELRRVSLRDALREQELAPDFDADVVAGLPPRAAAEAILAERGATRDDVLLDLLAARAERAFSARLAASGARLREGARDFVREAAATTRLAIVTRARRADVETMLRLASIDEFFTITVADEDVLEPKPSPAGYRLALDRLNRQRPIPPDAAIALEDGAAGLRSARDAGLRSIAVGPLPAHVALEANAYVPSLDRQTVRALDQLSRRGQERVQ